ncbi:MAG: TIGR03905 family TSCPD domain-containing protein [Coriobacteriaceae bacterium]|nr:TIGR03905 family TSCPD domain-containing protein [Coriobacteriaceae bacterium]
MDEHEPQYTYETDPAVCSQAIQFDLDDDAHIHNTRFFGGCNGNLNGISKLIEDMPAEQVIELLEGTPCGRRPTSCPDQLAHALREALEKRAAQD